jgi:hypothetical protein
MEAVMRACIVIVALAVLAMLDLIYTASTQDRTYGTFDCTVDCLGREAGYKWAEQHSVDDEDYCPAGNSQSFHEGCVAYIQDGTRGDLDSDDNGIGLGIPINRPDAGDDDDDN